MSEHTPGQWVQTTNTVYALNEAGENRFTLTVYADVLRGAQHGEGEANARLIAAAPDLLEACVSALDRIGSYSTYEDLGHLLESAIARATGEA